MNWGRGVEPAMAAAAAVAPEPIMTKVSMLLETVRGSV